MSAMAESWLGVRLQRPLNRVRAMFKREPIVEMAASGGARSHSLVVPHRALELGNDRGLGQPPAHVPDRPPVGHGRLGLVVLTLILKPRQADWHLISAYYDR